MFHRACGNFAGKVQSSSNYSSRVTSSKAVGAIKRTALALSRLPRRCCCVNLEVIEPFPFLSHYIGPLLSSLMSFFGYRPFSSADLVSISGENAMWLWRSTGQSCATSTPGQVFLSYRSMSGPVGFMRFVVVLIGHDGRRWTRASMLWWKWFHFDDCSWYFKIESWKDLLFWAMSYRLWPFFRFCMCCSHWYTAAPTDCGQVYEKIDCSGITDLDDLRFEFFVKQVGKSFWLQK